MSMKINDWWGNVHGSILFLDIKVTVYLITKNNESNSPNMYLLVCLFLSSEELLLSFEMAC